MAGGITSTGSLADSLPTWIFSARQVREYEGVMPQLVERQTLGEGLGTVWHEVSFAQLNAMSVTETTELDNPQQVSDTDLSITPTVIAVQVRITDRVRARIAKVAYAKMGGLAQNAVERKKDEDGITVLDSGGTTCSPGAGVTLTSGHIASAVSGIEGNTTEPGKPPFYSVLHPWQIKDLYDELVSGMSTYPTPEGPSARVFSTGFKLAIANVTIYPDGNITPDTGNDAKGGVFAREAIILVQGRAPRAVDVRREHIGGGATDVYHYDEYAYGNRSSTNWLYEIQSDAAQPTS